MKTVFKLNYSLSGPAQQVVTYELYIMFQKATTSLYQPTQVVLEQRPLNGCVCVFQKATTLTLVITLANEDRFSKFFPFTDIFPRKLSMQL